MADYLGNLVRRTRAAPAIRPRARSLFEPAKGGVGLMAAGHADLEIEKHVRVERESPSVPSATRRIEPEIQARSLPKPANDAPAPELPVRGERVVARREESRESPTGMERPVEPRVETPRVGEPESTLQIRTARRDVDPAPLPETPAAPARKIRPPAEPVPPEAATRTKTEPIRPAPIRPREHAVEQRLIEHALRAPGPDRPAGARISSSQTTAAETYASGPEIHIAIGRVIVHAAQETTSKPAPAQRPQTPRVPLEQYLQQRGGRA
jgi:hypothetical protein